MRIKQIKDEDFLQFRVCSMFIGTCQCSWKCCIEAGKPLCQNMPLAQSPTIEVDNNTIVERYCSNSLSHAIVFGGLEPLDQLPELISLIRAFREKTEDPIVIYTGYKEEEIAATVCLLAEFPNIIVKFGRYIPDQKPHYDEILGVNLASDNQYARKLG